MLVLLLLCGTAANAAEVACIDNPRRVGSCRVVHGRYSYWQGFPSARIWVIGTRKMIGVLMDEGIEGIPEYFGKNVLWNDNLFGDFYVCSLFEEPQDEHMEAACIQSWRNLVLQDRKDPTKPVRRLKVGPAPSWPAEAK